MVAYQRRSRTLLSLTFLATSLSAFSVIFLRMSGLLQKIFISHSSFVLIFKRSSRGVGVVAFLRVEDSRALDALRSRLVLGCRVVWVLVRGILRILKVGYQGTFLASHQWLRIWWVGGPLRDFLAGLLGNSLGRSLYGRDCASLSESVSRSLNVFFSISWPPYSRIQGYVAW